MTERRLTTLWAWVAENPDGWESMLHTATGAPLVDTNADALLDLRVLARMACERTGLHPEMATLVKFVREETQQG